MGHTGQQSWSPSQDSARIFPISTNVRDYIGGLNYWLMKIGIKKRNHKLLDYDQMRAKVKRLVEKPDKDPSKLPRVGKNQLYDGILANPYRRRRRHRWLVMSTSR